MNRLPIRRLTPKCLADRFARAGWSVMLALHGWILVASWLGDGTSFNSQVLLIGSNLFFFGKVLDLPILRVRPTRQSVVAGLLIVALFHVGAIDRALGIDADPLLWMQACISFAVLFGVSLLPMRRFARVHDSLATVFGERARTLADACNVLADDARFRFGRRLAVSSIISRPPPVR